MVATAETKIFREGEAGLEIKAVFHAQVTDIRGKMCTVTVAMGDSNRSIELPLETVRPFLHSNVLDLEICHVTASEVNGLMLKTTEGTAWDGEKRQRTPWLDEAAEV